jgi:hypothetical protein
LVSKYFECAALIPWLGEPLKSLLQRRGKGAIGAMRIRDERSVPFGGIIKYWWIYGMEDVTACGARF